MQSLLHAPDQPPTSESNPRGSRTRTGCWSCRARGVKCDEQRPKCQKCRKLDLTCQYGVRLQWVEDSIARGICHGRQGVWSSDSGKLRRQDTSRGHSEKVPSNALSPQPSPARFFFINTSIGDVEFYAASQSQTHHSADALLLSLRNEGGNRDLWELEDATSFGNSGRQPVVGLSSEELLRLLQRSLSHQWKLPNLNVQSSAGLVRPLDDYDGYILRFYDNDVCTRTTLLDDKTYNPLRFAVLPMISFSDTVLSAVLAISATKLAHTDPRFRAKSLRHRQEVISNLAKSLQTVNQQLINYLEALVSVIVLCWCDISDRCQPSWTNHLMGISLLLDACPEDASEDPYAMKLIQFCRQYFVYHTVMAKATFSIDGFIPNSRSALSRYLGQTDIAATSEVSSPEEHFSRLVLEPAGTNHEPEQGSTQIGAGLLAKGLHPDQIELHQGFSNTLLVLINSISDLVDVKKPSEGGTSNSETIRQLNTSLENLVQVPPNEAGQNPIIEADKEGIRKSPDADASPGLRLETIKATAEANRLAALIFLDDTCSLHFPDIVPACRRHRHEYIQKIFSLVEVVCGSQPVTAALPIWPMFIAGCSITNEDDRVKFLSILERFQWERLFGSVAAACAVVENVWRRRDLSSDETSRKSTSSSQSNTRAEGRRGKNEGGREGLTPAQPGSHAVKMRYPWESAMFMSGGSILSLT
ncbi:unnamed protein product [Clonostachys solani]|uniref:Zn(2)-C6 fungal-type domain-containing protein n=1 Tax=Clonostachys solani TaxID=160281 RepID=A0A9N9ZJ74_9HYPO|nr:unnamed protein product [Clonostachys solani]